MADIGQLVVKIAADASELTKALDDIEAGGTKSSAGIARAGKIMAGAFLAAGSAAVYMTIQAGKAAEEVDQLSHITGLSTASLQEYEVAMNRVGLTGQDMALMFKTLSKNLEEARAGSGEAADRFRQLGIDITKVTSTDDLLRKIFNSVSHFADGAEKAAIVGQLLGKTGLAWIPAMKEGAKALDDAAAKAKEMGALSQDQIVTLSKMDEAFNDLAMSAKFFAGNLGALLAPALQFVAELLTNFLSLMNAGLKATRDFLGLAHPEEAAGATGGKAPPILRQTRPTPALDAAQKAAEQAMQGNKRLYEADLANYAAILEQKSSLAELTELQIAKNVRGENEATAAKLVGDIEKQIEAYRDYAAQKTAAFGTDHKAVEERAKFEVESTAKILQLQNDLKIARTDAATQATKDATRIAGAIRKEELQALQDEVDRYQALDEIQQQYYENASIFEDAAGARRRVRIGLIEAEAEAARKTATQQIADQERLQKALQNIDQREQARKMAAAREFPNFFEKQLDDLTKANQFSVSLIVNQWTSALATIIVKGGDFKSVIEATEIAVVQAFINMGVQAAASAAKAALANEAAAAATTGGWEAAGTAIEGTFAAIGSAIATFWTEVLVPMFVAIGEAFMTFLSALAEAAADTIFGIPYAALLLAGVAVIGGAIAALATIAFADGGIVMQPTLGLVGEAGPEAIIPLDQAGGMFGGMQMVQVNTKLVVDGKAIARASTRHQASAWRLEGAPA
jgi:hypothetical protein